MDYSALFDYALSMTMKSRFFIFQIRGSPRFKNFEIAARYGCLMGPGKVI